MTTRGCLSRLFLFAVLAVLIGGGIAAYLLFAPNRSFSGEKFVDIERGTGTKRIAGQLVKTGVIQSPWPFLALRAIQPSAKLQAGEYRFDRPLSSWEVFDKLRRGDIYYHELRIPEGSNMFDIAAILKTRKLMDPARFLQAAANPSLIRDLSPQAPDLEGYLFPSTYRVTRQTTEEQLCKMMTTQFRHAWAKIAEAGPQPTDVQKTVTLASLVEKETSVPAERPLVAAVFQNRLRANMPLQCDPTTVYAALREGRYRGTIYRSDLASKNAYNTYAHPGLPPGAIANSGVESLRAAVRPAEVPYLYFVAKADGSGGHQFSETLTQHLHAVQSFRQARQPKPNGSQ